MSLIDKLREVEHFTPSAVPSSSELAEIVGKLLVVTEHGVDKFLEAAERDVAARESGEPANHVNELISPPPPPEQGGSPAAAPASGAPAGPAGGDPRDAEIASLEQQVANLQAALNRTQAAPAGDPPAPAPGAPESDVPPPPPAGP